MAQFGDFTVDRNSTKYVLGSGGDIISYATDEPAFEFNADGSYKGLLVEPAATNYCRQSEDFATTWNEEGLTSRSAVANTLTGLTDANELVEDLSASAQHRVYQTITIAPGTVYTASVYVKRGVGTRQFGIQNVFAGSKVYFDLGTGTVGEETNGTGEILDMGNGWYRCSATGTSTTTYTTLYLAICDGTTLGSETYNGDGSSSLILYGAQLETGPIATSYIPTTTASVTRVKDDITLGSASSLIGQTEGTLYVEVDWKEASGTFQKLLAVSDGTSSNRMLIYNSSGGELRMLAEANGTELTNQGESSSAYSGIQKIAFAYKTDDFELYRNGSSISSDTTGSLAALGTLTDIDLGQGFNAGAQANMHIRAVALYPTRLSDAECEALTTL